VDFQTGGPVAFDSKQPVMLQWSAARTAKSYVITIRRLNPDGADTAATIVAVLRTADTSLAIPASVFHDGGFFVLTLSATLASADDGADPLFTSEAPDELSTTISGRFRLSAS